MHGRSVSRGSVKVQGVLCTILFYNCSERLNMSITLELGDIEQDARKAAEAAGMDLSSFMREAVAAKIRENNFTVREPDDSRAGCRTSEPCVNTVAFLSSGRTICLMLSIYTQRNTAERTIWKTWRGRALAATRMKRRQWKQ